MAYHLHFFHFHADCFVAVQLPVFQGVIPTWRMFSDNRIIYPAIGIFTVLQLVYTYVLWFQEIFDIVLVSTRNWIIILAMGKACFLSSELGRPWNAGCPAGMAGLISDFYRFQINHAGFKRKKATICGKCETNGTTLPKTRFPG